MVPPLGVKVTVESWLCPSLHFTAVEYWTVWPLRSVSTCGVRTSEIALGGGTIVTCEVSDFVPPCCTAITRYVPPAVPAVYSPEEEMVPPVAVQVTWGSVEDPSLQEPATVNCWVPPTGSDTEDGLRMSSVRLGAEIVTALVSASVPPVCTAITGYVPGVLPAV